jgi:thiamine-phosphate pyrophosphorylase
MMEKSGGQRDFFLGGICFVTDRESCGLTCLEMVHIALVAGIKCIQFRDKQRSRLGFYRMATRLRRLTWDYGAYCIINDHADIAASVDADGVHLGQKDLPVSEARKIMGKGKIIGVSTHSLAEAVKAEEDGADYIGFGPVFPTATKDAGDPKGTGILGSIREKVNLPVVAIGGICLESMEEVFSSGADAVAAASAILIGGVQENAEGFVRKVRGIHPPGRLSNA